MCKHTGHVWGPPLAHRRVPHREVISGAHHVGAIGRRSGSESRGGMAEQSRQTESPQSTILGNPATGHSGVQGCSGHSGHMAAPVHPEKVAICGGRHFVPLSACPGYSIGCNGAGAYTPRPRPPHVGRTSAASDAHNAYLADHHE